MLKAPQGKFHFALKRGGAVIKRKWFGLSLTYCSADTPVNKLKAEQAKLMQKVLRMEEDILYMEQFKKRKLHDMSEGKASGDFPMDYFGVFDKLSPLPVNDYERVDDSYRKYLKPLIHERKGYAPRPVRNDGNYSDPKETPGDMPENFKFDHHDKYQSVGKVTVSHTPDKSKGEVGFDEIKRVTTPPKKGNGNKNQNNQQRRNN